MLPVTKEALKVEKPKPSEETTQQKNIYFIEVKTADNQKAGNNVMISLSGTKNGIPCETALMKLENPSSDDYELWKFRLESEVMDEILSCTILKDGPDQLELDFIKGTISIKQLPPFRAYITCIFS